MRGQLTPMERVSSGHSVLVRGENRVLCKCSLKLKTDFHPLLLHGKVKMKGNSKKNQKQTKRSNRQMYFLVDL